MKSQSLPLVALVLAFSFVAAPQALAVTRFVDAPQFSTGVFENAVVVADFNNDGFDDVAAAGSANSSDFVSILLGKGNGTFQKVKNFTTGSGPGGIAAADFNGDGKLDIVTSNFGVDDGFSNTVSVLLGNGDGTFQSRVDYVAGKYPNSVVAADVNNDGKVDLVVGITSAFAVLLGNGDGTFRAAIMTSASSFSNSVVVGDFNRDGKQDVAVAHQLNKQVGVFLGNGNGTFQPQQSYATGGATSIKVVDLNGDNISDLVASNLLDSTLSILLGNGDGTFQNHLDIQTAGTPDEVTVADFNGDHKMDLAVSESDFNLIGTTGVVILLGNGDGTFKNGRSYGAIGALAAGNFNRDSAVDLVGASSLVVSLMSGNGDGTFQTRSDYPAGATPSGIASADLNRDGKLDLAVASQYSNNTVSVLLGNGDGSFRPTVDYGVGSAPLGVAIADVNGDGKQDLVVADSGSNSISVLLGNGNGTFQSHVDYATGSTPSFVALGDVDGDGKLDAITANNLVNGNVSVLLGNGDGSFRAHVEYATGKNPAMVLIDDFNGDGKADLAVANSYAFAANDPVSVLLGNGDGTFQAHVDYPTQAIIPFLATGDVNRDGIKDLVAATGPILLGNGDGTFRDGGNFDFTAGGSAIVAADFNGDGKLDLVPSGAVFTSVTNLLLGKGDGSFGKTQPFAVGNTPLGVVSGDFNNDGAVDVITANYSTRNVSVLLNTGGTTVTLQSSENPSHAGDSVTFTATVVPTFSWAGIPTGTVTFKDGNTVLGSASLSGGQGSFTTAALGVGSHSITALYGGDVSFLRKKSGALSQNVLP
ncbi:MAG TPA: FG-GAP-like repeat-containing protein [Terriglobales bacterium]|nr:FG-GAP-like repeat-containing protein [Terriglobales bacterium]